MAIPLTPEGNLTRVQRKLLRVHECMAHIGLAEIQHLAREGYFGESLKCIASCKKPLCHACCLGKAHKRPVSSDTTPLKATHLHPGDCVACNQLESNVPGKLAVLKGNHLKMPIMPAPSSLTMPPIKSTFPCISLQERKRLFKPKEDLKN